MKYLGLIKITLLTEKQEYKVLFGPLSPSEYADLRESIQKAGIVNSLIVEKVPNGYIILSGHHRKAIAEALGIEAVPCSLAETPEEVVEALFDNVSRRQMTEEERKEKLKEKERILNQLYQDSFIPELYEICRAGGMDSRVAGEFFSMDQEIQKRIFHGLFIKAQANPGYAPGSNGEGGADAHQQLEAARTELAIAEGELAKAREQLPQDEKALDEIRKKVEDAIAKYEREKEQIPEEKRKAVEESLAGLEKERKKREAVVRAKHKEISALEGKIQVLNNTIYGLISEAALWRHEVARVSETYNYTIAYYSNPALLEVQLQVISEYVESLIRFARCHKWGEEALFTVEKYDRSIGAFLQDLIREVQGGQKEVLSVERSEITVAAQASALIVEVVTTA